MQPVEIFRLAVRSGVGHGDLAAAIDRSARGGDDAGDVRRAVVGEGLEPLARLAVVAVLRVIARDEVVEVAALKGVLLEREMQVRAQVVDPQRLRPRLLLRGLAVEEQDVCLHTLRVEDAGRQTQ